MEDTKDLTKERSDAANDLIEQINKADISPVEKNLFLKQALFQKDLATDINNAHLRIDHRKEDIEKINATLTSLSEKVEENTAYTKKQTEFTKKQTAIVNRMASQMKRNNKLAILVILAASALSLFLVFGGAEMLKRMGTLTTAVKAVEIVTKAII